jgi:hypothetical protein
MNIWEEAVRHRPRYANAGKENENWENGQIWGTSENATLASPSTTGENSALEKEKRIKAKRKKRAKKNGSNGESRKKKSGLTYEEKADDVAQLTEWIRDRLSLGTVPRTQDIVEHSLRSNLRLNRKEISRAVRLYPAYHLSSHQQREPRSSRKDRLIAVNDLGTLHGDIGFFPVSRDYETPKTFQHGFLVAKDVVSRYTYVELVGGERTAKRLIRVFEKIFRRHADFHPDYPIRKVQFDKEPGMKGPLMKDFLASYNVERHLFALSRSKAKFAEGAIRLVRKKVEILRQENPALMWWQILPAVERDLNSEEIIIQGKKMGYAPRDIDSSNVEDFLGRLQKKVPAYYFSQFRVPGQLVKWKFEVGDIVRPKTLLASSQVVGVKRSQINLEPARFEVVAREPFTTKDLSVRPGYKCVNLENRGHSEFFAEQDIALSY